MKLETASRYFRKNETVGVIPTDTVYGLGCDITNQKAIEAICRIRNIKPTASIRARPRKSPVSFWSSCAPVMRMS